MRSFLLFAAIVAIGATGCRDIVDGLSDDAPPACEVSEDCEGDLVCVSGHCGEPGSVGQNGRCWATRDCAEGLYCNPLSRTCATAGSVAEGETCGSDAECTAGLRCDLHGFQGVCTASGAGEPGGTCTGNTDCLAGLYCAADGTCKDFFSAYPPFTGVECAAAEGDFRIYFEVPRAGAPPADFYRLPFPNDARVNAEGDLDMSDFPRPGPTPLGVDLVQLYVDALVADFRGFAATASVLFRFAGEPDFDTITDNIQFVDVTEGSTFGQMRGFAWSGTTGRTKYNCENRLAVRNNPHEPLTPGHTYAIYLTTEVKSPAGTKAVADADFAAMLADSAPADAGLTAAWAAYAPLRAYLAAQAIQPGTIAGAAVFTVQDTTGQMERLAVDLAAQPAPVISDLTLCDTGVISPCDDGGERTCGAASPDFHEVHGKLSVPIYQEGEPPYLTAGGAIVEVDGVPVKQRDESVCFALTIPKGVEAPAEGWPLVVYGHGTGGSMRSFVDDVGATMATAETPAAVLGIDMIHHGARRGSSTEDPDNLVFNPLNPEAARDNLIQGAVDLLQAERVASLPAFEVTGVGPVVFDDARVLYFGHSQGSQSGVLAAAADDMAGAVVFSGVGGFLTSTLLAKTSPVNIAAGMKFLFGDELDGNHPVLQIMQTYFEPSDAINYAPEVFRNPPAGVLGKHVFMTYGKGDTFTPTDSQKHIARALGVQVVAPFLLGEDFNIGTANRPVTANVNAGSGGKRTGVCVQYAPTPEGAYDGHFVSTREDNAVADWTAFFASYLATGTPVVP